MVIEYQIGPKWERNASTMEAVAVAESVAEGKGASLHYRWELEHETLATKSLDIELHDNVNEGTLNAFNYVAYLWAVLCLVVRHYRSRKMMGLAGQLSARPTDHGMAENDE